MQSMGMSMDWTLEDNRVNGLFFCATQAADEVIPHLYKLEQKCQTLLQARSSQNQAPLGRVIMGGWVLVPKIIMHSLVALSVHSTFHW